MESSRVCESEQNNLRLALQLVLIIIGHDILIQSIEFDINILHAKVNAGNKSCKPAIIKPIAQTNLPLPFGAEQRFKQKPKIPLSNRLTIAYPVNNKQYPNLANPVIN